MKWTLQSEEEMPMGTSKLCINENGTYFIAHRGSGYPEYQPEDLGIYGYDWDKELDKQDIYAWMDLPELPELPEKPPVPKQSNRNIKLKYVCRDYSGGWNEKAAE